MAAGLVELWQGAQEEATEGPEQNHTELVGIQSCRVSKIKLESGNFNNEHVEE